MSGAEEFYRARQRMGPAPTDATQSTMALLDRQADRRQRELERRALSEEQSIRDRYKNAGDALVGGVEGYQKGQRHGAAMKRSEEDSAMHALQMEDSQRALKRAQAEDEEYGADAKLRGLERDYWQGTEEGSTQPRLVAKAATGYKDYMDEMSRNPGRRNIEEQGAKANVAATEASIEGTKAGTRLTNAQIAQVGRDNGIASDNRREIVAERAVADYRVALASGDKEIEGAVDNKLKKANFNSAEIALLKRKATAANATAGQDREMAQDLAVHSSPAGGMALEKISKLDGKLTATRELVGALNEYQRSNVGSGEADAALANIRSSLEALGRPEAAQVDSLLTVDTGGIKGRTTRVQQTLQNVIGDLKREVAALKAQHGSLQSTQIRNNIQALEQQITGLQQMAGDGTIRLIGGGGAPNNRGFLNTPVQAAPPPVQQPGAGAPPPAAQGGPGGSPVTWKGAQPDVNAAPGPSARHRAIAQPMPAGQVQK